MQYKCSYIESGIDLKNPLLLDVDFISLVGQRIFTKL